ncbi:MAG: tetratricopeptide repeat protein [Sphingobacteriia bacterium]|nr:tetratricopeptide repeat protein [Sphingobacteriia bacterium]
MKYFFSAILFLLTACSIKAQDNYAQKYDAAHKLLMQGDLEKASAAYTELLQKHGDSLEVLKDWVFINILINNFTKAAEVGKLMIERPDADEQCFQLLGMSYKSTKEYKECDNVYKKALKKFPNSGVIYNEMGELGALQKNLPEAIVSWEKGIEADANYSSNYYNAVMYYDRFENNFKTIIYGEQFLNLESYTTRSADIKSAVYDAYVRIYTEKDPQNWIRSTASDFEKAFFTTLSKSIALAKDGINPENLSSIRTRFVLDWFASGKNEKLPFYLFNYQQYLLQEGLFDAYNQWMFGPAVSTAAYKIWVDTHDKQAAAFRKYQQSHIMKFPAGQYYK